MANLIVVYISGHLRHYIGDKKEFGVDGANSVVELVRNLNELFPGIGDRIMDEHDRTREYVNIFVNGENIRDGDQELTKLKDGDSVHVLPSIAGG